jgi:hypothetical protein
VAVDAYCHVRGSDPNDCDVGRLGPWVRTDTNPFLLELASILDGLIPNEPYSRRGSLHDRRPLEPLRRVADFGLARRPHRRHRRRHAGDPTGEVLEPPIEAWTGTNAEGLKTTEHCAD